MPRGNEAPVRELAEVLWSEVLRQLIRLGETREAGSAVTALRRISEEERARVMEGVARELSERFEIRPRLPVWPERQGGLLPGLGRDPR